MFMMTSKILKFVNFAKTQKFRYLENEALFLQIKNLLITIKAYFIAKSSFQWRYKIGPKSKTKMVRMCKNDTKAEITRV